MASSIAIKSALGALLALAFISWILSLVGLAGLQRNCYSMSTLGSAIQGPGGIETGAEPLNSFGNNLALTGVRGFNGNLKCERVYSYYWFMIAFELISLIALTCLAAFGLLAASALSFMAWLTVLAVLFLQGSDSFLALKDVPYGMGESNYSYSRLTAAGWILTAIANLGLIFLLAWRPRKLRNAAPGGSIRY